MRVWACLWTVYLVWGSTYLGIRYMVESIPPLLGSGLRFFVAGLLFAAFVAVAGRGVRSLRVPRRELVSAAVCGIVLLFLGNGMVSVAEDVGTPSGLAALVVASVPLWVVLFRRLTGEPVARTTSLWVLAGFAGVALLLLPGERPDDAPIGGILIVVGAAFFWASGSFASSRVPLPRDPVVSTVWQLVFGGVAMTLAGLVAGEAGGLALGDVTWRSWVAFAYLVVFGSLLAFSAYTWLLRHAPISQVATYAYVNPVVAIGLGAFVAGEELTPLVAVAALVIVASVAGTVRQEAPRPAVATPTGAEDPEPEPARAA